ncbi:DUF2806 domain-containing protein [Streptococcus suis]|uniref:DUF2806 domain-containing protein n=1 Tax=Streptococcus suis TaxID=1307 RepID=UPI001ABE3F05|nr:DUF2806 domain-containing protein [Streptococcus suis]
MFTLKELLHLLETERIGWKNPTEMTKAILMSLTDMNYPSDVASKVFSGVNAGRNIRLDMETVISEEGYDAYIKNVETRLRNQNFREGNFDYSNVCEKIATLLKEATNLNQEVYLGLSQSFVKNKTNRPYLFLAECFYYALETAHNKAVTYRRFEATPSTVSPVGLEAWSSLIEFETIEEELSPQFLSVVSKMTKREIDIFLKLAELCIYDEDEDYYLYAPITDSEIALYKQFGVGNQEFLLMEEFGLINLGARVDNILEVTDEPAGFQNDNLVFALTTAAEPVDVHFRSYPFTTVGLKLLEILGIETDDDFFEMLTQLFVQQHSGLPIDFYLVPVEAMEEAENKEELEEYQLI